MLQKIYLKIKLKGYKKLEGRIWRETILKMKLSLIVYFIPELLNSSLVLYQIQSDLHNFSTSINKKVPEACQLIDPEKSILESKDNHKNVDLPL